MVANFQNLGPFPNSQFPLASFAACRLHLRLVILLKRWRHESINSLSIVGFIWDSERALVIEISFGGGWGLQEVGPESEIASRQAGGSVDHYGAGF